jgi:hypothetical protein
MEHFAPVNDSPPGGAVIMITSALNTESNR